MKYNTNYYVATHWFKMNLILCNEIPAVDDSIWEHCNWELDAETEIFQWLLTSVSEDDAEWLAEHFGLLFTYSEKLDLYVLAVPHYGTSWDYVYCETDIENAKAELGDTLNLDR